MNISLKWLKEYVNCPLRPEQVAEALTSIGLEVGSIEEVQSIKGGLAGLYVGQVLTCEAHPNSDHLHVTTVDLGRQTPSQIVCGAPNVAAGQKVIVADIGCTLYDGDKEFVIKKSKLRGIESHGMICAEDEIGIGTSHEGIMVLPEDAVVGTPAAEYFNIESDWLIEIDITANRSDALSHWGVARELYAWMLRNGYEATLTRPADEALVPDSNELPISVEIHDKEACRRYACVSISGCHVAESPDWLKNKLLTVGLRPINNIVDITNYIMMAYGQPMHCFDADMVKGHKIIVRTQPEGTPFTTLDGEEHKLGPHDLSICNAEEPMCIAGIFGGKGSGTYETTTNVVLESAYFHPTWIRKSARRHGLSTDASYRFERGIDPNGVVYALKQAALMVRELTSGRISSDIVDVYPSPIENVRVRITYRYIDDIIGKHIPQDLLRNIVESLGMQIIEEDTDGMLLDIPAYRVDVTRPCDVVEEILRIYGYNNIEIPTQLKSSLTTPTWEDKRYHEENLVGEMLVGCGFNEILNNSLTKRAYYQDNEAYPAQTGVAIINPLSQDLGVMRQTLLYGGLESIARNVNRQIRNLRFFEMGNVYTFSAERHTDKEPIRAYKQRSVLGLWMTGKRVEGSWAHPDEDTSVYELKAHVLNILIRTGISESELAITDTDHPAFSAACEIKTRRGRSLAIFGIVAPSETRRADLDCVVFFAEIDWDAVMSETASRHLSFTEISKYPPVSRDIALLVDKDVEFAQIEQIARQTEKKLLRKVELFDVYEGKNLPEGKKSYAVNFILQDTQKTLNDKQIDAIMTKLVNNLKTQLKAEQR